MKGSWLLIGATAAGVLLGGARGARADQEWYGHNEGDRGQSYEQRGWNDRGQWTDPRDRRTDRAGARMEWRDGRGDRDGAGRTDGAVRAGWRGHDGQGQPPFAYIGAADRERHDQRGWRDTGHGSGYDHARHD